MYRWTWNTHFDRRTTSLLWNMLAGKGIVRAGSGIKRAKRIVRAGCWKRMRFSMPSHPLSNFATQKYYENKPIFNPTGTPPWIDVDSMWILHRHGVDQILKNFHVVSTYFFDVISMVKKCTSFSRTFFDVISMIEKSTLFPRTFFDVISMAEKSTLFSHTFFDVISFVKISTVFLLTFFDLTLMVE